eukprot:scaffold396382_cov51-Attheya_sp.AAC.1
MRDDLADDVESQIDVAGAASSQTGGGEEIDDFKDHSVDSASTKKSPDSPVIESKKKKKKKKKKRKASLDSIVTDDSKTRSSSDRSSSITSRLSSVPESSSNTRNGPPSSASIDADVLAKQQGRQPSAMSATSPGAVTINTRDNDGTEVIPQRSNGSAAGSLHSLEDDIMAKARSSSRSSSTTTQPGAAAISANEPDRTAAKRQSGGGQRTLASIRRQMKELEKTTPAGSSQQGQQSQVQSQAQPRRSATEQRQNALNWLEEDAVAKNMMRNDANRIRSSINPIEPDSVIQELDPDFIAKQHQAESHILNDTSRGVQGAVRSIRKGMSKLGSMTRSIGPLTTRPGAYHAVSQPPNNNTNNSAQSSGNQRTPCTSQRPDFDPDWDGEPTPECDVANGIATEISLSNTRPASLRPGRSSAAVWNRNTSTAMDSAA